MNGRWPLAVTEWVTRESDPRRAIDRIAAAGYRAIELSADPAADAAALRRAVDDAGLEVTSLCARYSLERDCASEDPGLRRAALEYLRGCIDLAGEVGAGALIVVPTYRVEWEVDRPAELSRAAETIAQAAEHVPAGGPVLALEALNRYETHLIRTLAEADELRRMVDHPAVQLMADLFHMNIEEDAVDAALRAHGEHVAHVHLADSQRREPGSGHLDFVAAFAALDDVGYDGALSMEFLPATDDAMAAGRDFVEGLVGAA